MKKEEKEEKGKEDEKEEKDKEQEKKEEKEDKNSKEEEKEEKGKEEKDKEVEEKGKEEKNIDKEEEKQDKEEENINKEEYNEKELNNTQKENENNNEEETQNNKDNSDNEKEQNDKESQDDKENKNQELHFKEYNLRNLETVNFDPESKKEQVGGKNIYILNLQKDTKKIEVVIEKKDNKKLDKPFCIIKYEFNEKFEKEITEFNNNLEISKTNNSNIELNFKKIPKEDNIEDITYTAYICENNIDLDYIHPKYLEQQKGCIKKDLNNNDEKKINLSYNLKEDQDYTVVVLATVKYKGDVTEDFIYKTQKLINKKIINNDLKFYIIMGVFAFVIILVFIIIFRIISKRKANNPDIDDEEYSNLQVLRDTINEDES